MKKRRQRIPLPPKRKKLRLKKIKYRIVGRLYFPDFYIPCKIRRGRKLYESRQSIKSCISKYFLPNDETTKLFPDCAGCERWIEYLPETYYGEVFGKDSTYSDEPIILKTNKRKRK